MRSGEGAPRDALASSSAGSSERARKSHSGLKTAVLNAVRAAGLDADAPRTDREEPSAESRAPSAAVTRADVARAFQDALVETLVEKTFRAARDFGRTKVVLGGGVACNQTLVRAMRARLEGRGVSVFAPTPRLATDNAAMIARAGLFRYERGERSGWELNAYASRDIPGLVR